MNKNTRARIKLWRKWVKMDTGKPPQYMPRKSTKPKVANDKKD